MYSSEDLASFYFQYQTKALPYVKFLQSFCMKHKVTINLWKRRIKRDKCLRNACQ